MRRGTNSCGPGGLIRDVLRVGLLVLLTAGLMLMPGFNRAVAQAHGRDNHFGGSFGGGWRGVRDSGGWRASDRGIGFNHGHGGGSGGFQQQGHENRRTANPGRQETRGGPSQSGRGMRPGNSARRAADPRAGGGAGGGSGLVGPAQSRNEGRAGFQAGNGIRPGMGPREGGPRNGRTGQEHLPQWWAAHRGLSPQRQADAMRREPGFRSLPQGQQQRLLDRLRSLDARPPQVQQRMLNRVEMFERLSPERQQEVRGASQTFREMPPQRKQMMIHAFQQLRQMPPGEREQMLHSSYGQQFTPQERTVLGNLLSIEPYRPQISEPYFGRP